MPDIPDVDIEVKNRDEVAALFPEAVPASQPVNRELVRHTSGLYFQNIPVNPLNGFAAYPFRIAEDLDFYKIDLLSAPNPYDAVGSMAELRALVASPIDWSWFKNVEFTATLFQLHNVVDSERTVADVVAHYSPASILDLACMLAIIRPGKKHLIGQPWDVVREQIWEKEPSGKRQFKKSHAVAYALVVGIDARIKARTFFDGMVDSLPS